LSLYLLSDLPPRVFDFRLYFFFASKRNEANRDPFRMRFACSLRSFRFSFFAIFAYFHIKSFFVFAFFRFINFLLNIFSSLLYFGVTLHQKYQFVRPENNIKAACAIVIISRKARPCTRPPFDRVYVVQFTRISLRVFSQI
jgi:hypothetical protein